MSKEPIRCAVYVRISLVEAKKQGVSVGVHLDECREYAQGEGWQVVGEFVDENVSASRFSKKPRKDYLRLLDFLKDAKGRAKSLVVLSTEMERLYRRMDELLPLITLAEQGGPFAVVQFTDGARYDLATATGATAAMEVVAKGVRESGKLSERTRRRHQRELRRGAWDGEAPFGYRKVTVKDEAGEDILSLEIVPEEADLLRQAADRILTGESLRGIASSWGGRWRGSNLRRMLTNVTLIGKRQTLGYLDGRRAQGPYEAGIWEPIFDSNTWVLLQAVLTDPSRRKKPVDTGRKHLLSGFIFCGACGHRLNIGWNPNGAYCYRCPSGDGCGRVSRVAAPLEDRVREHLFHWLDSGAYDQAWESLRMDDVTYRGLIDGREKLRGNLERIRVDYEQGAIRREAYTVHEIRINSELGRVDTELRNLQSKRTVAATSERGSELAKAWEQKWDLDKKRALIGALIDRIVVQPLEFKGIPLGGGGGKVFNPKGVQVLPGDWAQELDDPNVLTLPPPARVGEVWGLEMYEAALAYFQERPNEEIAPSVLAKALGITDLRRVWRVTSYLMKHGLIVQTREWAPGPGHPSLFRAVSDSVAASA